MKYILPPLLLATLACTGVVTKSPEDTVKAYFEAGAADDLDTARSYVDPECHNRPMGKAAVVRILGNPVDIESIDVVEKENDGQRAVVAWSVSGSLDAKDAKAKVLGAEIDVSGMGIAQLDQSGTYTLEKMGGAWRITCK